MEAHQDAVRAAQELLASLALDDDIHAYLCQGLDDALDLEEEELRDFLAPFLPSDALDKMVRLQSSASVSRTRNDDARRDTTVVSTQNHQSMSMSVAVEDVADQSASAYVSADVAAEDVAAHTLQLSVAAEDVADQSAQQRTLQKRTQKKRTSAPRRTVQPKAKRVGARDVIDETSCCDAEETSQVFAETGVLNARAVKAGHYVLINSRSCRVEKLIGTQKAWKGPETGCFKTHFIARCIFTGKKIEHFCLATADVSIASVQNLECTVMDIGDAGELTLLTTALDEKSDVNLPTETEDDRKLAERIKRDFRKGKTIVVRVMSSCGVQKVVEVIEHKCTDGAGDAKFHDKI